MSLSHHSKLKRLRQRRLIRGGVAVAAEVVVTH